MSHNPIHDDACSNFCSPSTVQHGLKATAADELCINIDEECSMPLIGLDADQALQDAFDAICKIAANDGASEWFLFRLPELLHKFKDVFRIRLGPDGPAKVRSLELQIEPGATPVRSKTRRHPQAHHDFMREHVRQLTQYDLIYPNQASEWASAAFAVPKPGDRGLRMVIDLRAVNDRTVRFVWPMNAVSRCSLILPSWFNMLLRARCF
jgi:hypothetical protein